MEMLSILRPDGAYDAKLEPDLSDEDLMKMYRYLVLVRKYSERGMNLQRQGRIGFFIASTGQEACQIGAGFALNAADWVYPTYRDIGICFLRGVPLRLVFDQLYGNSEDVTKGRQMSAHFGYRDKNIVTFGSPVAAQILHAVGTAYAVKYKNHKVVTVTFLGEGATSQGEFHTAMNFAGVFKLPLVFFCENNQYAISLPVRRQTASENIAMKAWGYGFEGTQVDGNDILAVYKATKDAVDKARSGGGPTLIEAVTYRIGGHSTADDPSKYRNQSELELWKKRDPIMRFRIYLTKKGLLSEQEDMKIQQEAESQVAEAAKEAERAPPPNLSTMFTDVFEEMPWHLKEEMDELMKEGA